MKKTTPLLFLVTLFLAFQGCMTTVKPGTRKSGASLYESFFVGEEGTQYFIKPLLFEGKSDNVEELSIDFTFRYNGQIKDSVTTNFTLLGDEVNRTIDSLILLNGQDSFSSSEVVFFFNKKEKKGIETRFSTKYSLEAIDQLFRNSKWEIKVYQGGKTYEFEPGKTSKKIKSLDENLFGLFR